MERPTVGLVNRVVHSSDVIHDRLPAKDVALLAQLAAEHDVIVDRRQLGFLRRSLGEHVAIRRRTIGFQALLVLDRKVLSQIRQAGKLLEADIARELAILGRHRYALGYQVFPPSMLVHGLLVLVQHAHIREYLLTQVAHDRLPPLAGEIHGEGRQLGWQIVIVDLELHTLRSRLVLVRQSTIAIVQLLLRPLRVLQVAVKVELVSLQRLVAGEDLPAKVAEELAGHRFPAQGLELDRRYDSGLV